MARIAVAVDSAMNGTRELVAAPGALKAIRLIACSLWGSAGDGTLVLQDGASSPVAFTGTVPITIATHPAFKLPPMLGGEDHWGQCTTNKALNAVLSANMDLDGILVYEIVTA